VKFPNWAATVTHPQLRSYGGQEVRALNLSSLPAVAGSALAEKKKMSRVETAGLIQFKKVEESEGLVVVLEQATLAYCEEEKDIIVSREKEGSGEEVKSIGVSPFEMVQSDRDMVIRGGQSGLEIKLDTEMGLGEKEIMGMNNMFGLVRVDPELNLILWISPSGGPYIGARVVAAQPRILNGKIVLDCRGIVCCKTPEELMQIATSIFCFEGGVVKSWVSDAEGLRSQPIGVDLEGEGWIDFCKRMFTGMDDVWEAIRVGRDIEVKNKIKSHVRAVYEELSESGLVGREWDVAFEEGMGRRGYWLNVVANHGGSALNEGKGVFNGVFNEGKRTRIDSMGKKETYCDKCHMWHEGKTCPYCGE